VAEPWDIIVIGAGHNGLALACYLAKAGRKVLVLERRDISGGGVISQELIPGFTINTHAMNHHWLHIGPVYMDLELGGTGVRTSSRRSSRLTSGGMGRASPSIVM
jgi:phytoene dehydrogenase-like protein